MQISTQGKTGPYSKTRKRITITAVAFCVFLAFLFYNLFSLQLLNYAYYKNKVYDQITTSSALKAKRGNIYDSNMNLLATEKTVWRIFVSSREIKKQEKYSCFFYLIMIPDTNSFLPK